MPGLSRLRRGVLSLVAAGVFVATQARGKDETELYDSGVGLLGEKKWAAAEAEFRQAVSLDPRYREAWQALADVLRLEGKIEQADAVQKIAAASPAARSGVAP